MTSNTRTFRKSTMILRASAAAILTACASFSVQAQSAEKVVDFDLPAQNLDDALKSLGYQSERQVMFTKDIVNNKTSKRLSGEMTPTEALDELLHDTGLDYEVTSSDVILIKVAGQESAMRDGHRDGGLLRLAQADAPAARTVRNEGAPAEMQADTIIVTASRREQNLQDTPMSVSVIEPDSFVAAGLSSVQDVISYTPAFNFNTAGNGGQTVGRPKGSGTISARGVGQQGFGNVSTAVVGVYVDDVQVGNSTVTFDGLIADLERLEFLKGPQGTLYGATSVGGAIRYVTRKPALDEARGQVSADLSSTENGGFNQIYSGKVSLPIISDRLGISVGGYYEEDGGFIDSINPDGSIAREDADEYDSFGVFGDILFKFNDRFEFRGRYFNQEIDYTDTSFIRLLDNGNGVLEQVAGPYQHPTEGDLPHETKNTIYAGTLEYAFDWATLTSTSSYVEFSHIRGIDNPADSFLAQLVDNTLEGNPAGTTQVVEFRDGGETEKFVQEIRLTSENSDSIEWLVGLYYTDEQQIEANSLIARPTDFDLSSADQTIDSTEYAAFGNVTYYLTPDFDVTAGVRLARYERDIVGSASGFITGQVDPIESIDDTVDTYLFALRYRPSEDLSLYARVASGYRPGRGIVPVVNVATGEETPPVLESDSLWSYEFGAKGVLADGLISYDLAAWYISWDNFQTTLRLTGISTAGNAAGGITSQGVEGNFVFQPADGLSITSGFAYTDSTLNDDEPLFSATAGQQLPYEPEWKVSSRARYDFSLGASADAHIGGGVRYVGDQRTAFEDRNGFNPSRVNIPVESYVIADIEAGVDFGNFAANFYVNNLFDEYALTSISGQRRADGSIDGRSALIRSRTFGVVLTAGF